jgi:uncharacterized protein
VAKKTAKRTKHVPQRTCLGCRQVLAKRTMTRIVRTPEGLRVDPTGKLPGRGAYLHNLRICWERALKGALAHALNIQLTDQDRETLKEFSAGLPVEDEHPEVQPSPNPGELPAGASSAAETQDAHQPGSNRQQSKTLENGR